MIIIKTNKEIEILAAGGKILAGILNELKILVKPGVTTGDLEKTACDLIKKAGGCPSFKNYKTTQGAEPFPTAICASINNEVVHAPSRPSRELKSGDIFGLDIGMEYPFSKNQSGYFTDMSQTIAVGRISEEAKRLIEVTKKSLELAIKQVSPGNTLNDIGRTVQQFVEASGFSVVRDLVGHGVGREVHEEPPVPNFAIIDESKNEILKPGMVLAIEPMVNVGSFQIKTAPDGFTILTADGGLSAHFEHTVAVTKDGHQVLTII